MSNDYHALIMVCWHYAFMTSLQSALFPAVLTTVQATLDASNFQMASLVAVYDLVQVLASFAFAALCLHVGCARSLALGAIFSIAGALCFSFANGFGFLVVGQFIMGVGSSSITVLCPHLMTIIASSHSQASQYLSYTYASASIGVVVGYVATGAVGPDRWRWLFIANGALLVPVVVSFIRRPMETESKHQKTDVAADDEDGLVADDLVALSSMSIGGIIAAVAQVLRHKTVVLSILSQSFMGFGVAALISFIPKYVTIVLNQTPAVASYLMAVTVPATACGALASGWLAHRLNLTAFDLSKLLVCCCSLSMSLLVMFLTPNVPLFTLLLVVEMFVVFASMVPSIMIFPRLLPRSLVPFANGLANASIRLLGSVPGPVVLGLLLDYVGETSQSSMQYCYLGVGMYSLCLATVCSVISLLSYAPDSSVFSLRSI